MQSKGCAYLMDMGTGKTITTIAVAGTLFNTRNIKRLLVVSPKSIVQVWQQECLVAQGRIKEAYELYRQVEKLYMTELDAPPPERMRARFRNPEKEPWRQSEHIGAVRRWLRESNQDGPYLDAYAEDQNGKECRI